MPDCCIICYKVAPPISSLRININNIKKESSKLLKDQEYLKRFFRLLQSYLGGAFGKEDLKGRGPSEHGILEKAINAGFASCEDCSKIVISFCELYNRIEKLELLLNCKLQTVTEILERSGKECHKVRAFGERISQSNIEGVSGYEIWCFKKQLVHKCERKLLRSTPVVRICKYEPPKVEQQQQRMSKIPRTLDAILPHIKLTIPTTPLQILKEEPVETLSHQDESNIGNFVIPTPITKIAVDGRNSVRSEQVIVKTEPETDPLADVDDGATAVSALIVKSEPVPMETDSFHDDSDEQGDNESFPVIASIHYSQQQVVPLHSETSPGMECESDSSKGSNTIFVKPVETITKRSVTSRLRNVHRCTKCAKTFSTLDKLEKHELSHVNDEGWDKWPSPANSSCDEDSDEDAASDSGSEFSEEYCSDDETQHQRVKRPWLPSLNPIPLYREQNTGIPLNTTNNPSKTSLTIYKICDFENCQRPLFSKSQYDNHQKYHFYRNRYFSNTKAGQHERESLPKMRRQTETQKRVKYAEDSKQLNPRTSAPKPNLKVRKSSPQSHSALPRKQDCHIEASDHKKDDLTKRSGKTDHKCNRNGCTATFRTVFQLQVHNLTVHGIPLKPKKFPTSAAQHFHNFKSNHQKGLTELSIFKKFKMKADPKHGNGMSVSLIGKYIKVPGKISSTETAKKQSLPNSQIKITNKALNSKTVVISSKSRKLMEINQNKI